MTNHADTDTRTLRQWADSTGKNADSVAKAMRRRNPGASVSLDDVLTPQQWADITGWQVSAVSVRVPAKRTDKTKRVSKSPQASENVPAFGHPKEEKGNPEGNPTNYPTTRTFLLYALMAIPAVASIQNMHRVTFDIAGHEFTALLLTGLFSASPFLFVLAGMRNRATVALVGILIAYECFCNFTRIYGGLTGFGHDGFPTRFLGLATDIFNSGTRGTALLLAGIMSAMAAAVFYVAFSELNKKAK